MTKNVLLASAALAFASLASFPANAAGEWTGIYIGGHVGGIWGDIDVTTVSDNSAFYDPAPGDVAAFSPNGVLGGAQFGYNYQWNNIVVGIELDGSATDFDESLSPSDDINSIEMDWLATAALRVGYVVMPNSLVYLKGGAAAAKLQHNVVDTVAPAGAFTTDETHTGWIAGAGFEQLISDNVSVGVEYNYIDLGDKDHTGTSGASTLVDSIGGNVQTVSVRLNWHWNPSF